MVLSVIASSFVTSHLSKTGWTIEETAWAPGRKHIGVLISCFQTLKMCVVLSLLIHMFGGLVMYVVLSENLNALKYLGVKRMTMAL